MVKKMILAASAMAAVALPSAAEAQYYGGYRGNPYYGGYSGAPYYGSRYTDPYYGNRYYGSRYSRHRHDRCGNGTTGLIVGGAAGALIGREVGRNSGSYYRRGDGTTGAIIGGALGALVGREVARGC